MLPGEWLGDDGLSPEEPGLEGRVLPGAALAVVLVTHNHPLDAFKYDWIKYTLTI